MKRCILIFGFTLGLLMGKVPAQGQFIYAKAKSGKKKTMLPFRSIRIYDDIQGQVLFLRSLKEPADTPSVEIYDDPGGVIRFFPTDSLYASVMLGQTTAEIRLLSGSSDHSQIWQLTSPGDTVYLASISEPELPSKTQSGFRLFKRIQAHAALGRSNSQLDVDLLHFFHSPQARNMVKIEVLDSLSDYSKIFPITAVAIIFKQCLSK